MNHQVNIIDRFPSLSMALVRLLEGKEKSWGYFQVIQDKEFYQLEIPLLGIMRFYQNENQNIYRVYWHDREEYRVFWQDLERKDYQNETYREKAKRDLAIFIRKKQRKVGGNIQKQYEVVYKFSAIEGIQTTNKLLASLIRDRVQEYLNSHPTAGEVAPLVTVAQD
jgi:hypothetical protein